MNLHNLSWAPEDGVVVVILGRVEPWLELHLLVSLAFTEHIRVDGVRLSGFVSEELVVDLVVVVAQRRCLKHT